MGSANEVDLLFRVGQHYATVRRYTPTFLGALPVRTAAKNLLTALDVLRQMNATGGASCWPVVEIWACRREPNHASAVPTPSLPGSRLSIPIPLVVSVLRSLFF